MNIYSIFDNKALAYNQPFLMKNDNMATRAFSNLANDPESNISANPDDFVLYQIGSFDETTGLISHLDPILNLGTAHLFVKESKK